MARPREVTNKLLEMLDEGLLSYQQVVLACFSYMSEQDVADMALANDFLEEEEEEEEQEKDDTCVLCDAGETHEH